MNAPLNSSLCSLSHAYLEGDVRVEPLRAATSEARGKGGAFITLGVVVELVVAT